MTKIFLDLEETVINNWQDGLLTQHVEQIKKMFNWLNRHGYYVESYGIFSFAICNDEDMYQFFERGMVQQLANALEIDPFQMKDIVTCDRMLAASKEFSGLHYESWSDFCTLKGKHGAFKDWALLHADKYRNDNWVLIDDVVPMETTFRTHTDVATRGAFPQTKISTIPVHMITNGFRVDRKFIFG